MGGVRTLQEGEGTFFFYAVKKWLFLTWNFMQGNTSGEVIIMSSFEGGFFFFFFYFLPLSFNL